MKYNRRYCENQSWTAAYLILLLDLMRKLRLDQDTTALDERLSDSTSISSGHLNHSSGRSETHNTTLRRRTFGHCKITGYQTGIEMGTRLEVTVRQIKKNMICCHLNHAVKQYAVAGKSLSQ